MQYENGKIYEIITPAHGALFYKYQNNSFSSVDRYGNSLDIRYYCIANDGTPGAATNGVHNISVDTLVKSDYIVGAVDDWAIWKSFTSPTIGGGVMLNVDPRSEQYSSGIMQALMEDSATMTLYTCVQAMMPYMVTIANATKCLSSTQISFDMISMRHSQSVLSKQVAMEKMLEEIRNSKLMKFIASPWFIIILVLAAVLIAALCIITGGAALAAIIPAVVTTIVAVSIAVATAVALITTISVFYAQDKKSMDNLVKSMGYNSIDDMPTEVRKIYDKIQQALDVAFALAFVTIVISCISMGYGGMTINTTVAQMASQLAKTFNTAITKAIINIAIISAIVSAGASISVAVLSCVSGITAIVEGIVRLGIAAMEHAISTIRAQVDGLSAMSKLFKDLMSRMEQSLKVLMEALQNLIKSQGEIIKTLGEGSRTITRNIAGI
ncbi:MAG: hypothetical protein LBF26_01300 [Puniceicoccales bacterium]|jgi:hypothetical protein|nr:hypothetical protein [Puniceicoccales bacterium]